MTRATGSISAFLAAFWAPALVYASTPQVEFGYGEVLLRTVFVLAGVCLLAWVLLRWGLRRFVSGADKGQTMSVIARLPLEPRRTLILVKVGEQRLLLASSEAGVHRVATLTPDELGERTFAEVLDRAADVSRETPEPEAEARAHAQPINAREAA